MNIEDLRYEMEHMSPYRLKRALNNIINKAVDVNNYYFINSVIDLAVDENDDDGFGTEGLYDL